MIEIKFTLDTTLPVSNYLNVILPEGIPKITKVEWYKYDLNLKQKMGSALPTNLI